MHDRPISSFLRGVLRHYRAGHVLLCLGVEFVLISGAVLVSVGLYFMTKDLAIANSTWYLPHAFLTAVICQLGLYYGDLYELRVALPMKTLLIRLTQSFGVAATFLGVVFYVLPWLFIGGRTLVFSLALAWGLLVGWRLLYQHLHTLDQFHVNILIIGTNEAAQKVARELMDNQPLGYNLRGFLGDSDEVGKDVL